VNLPRVVAVVGGAGFVAAGVWAMLDPRSFFGAVARFEPYNQHFLQDVGAFQVGLGVVLLLAGLSGRANGLTVALVGVGVAATLIPGRMPRPCACRLHPRKASIGWIGRRSGLARDAQPTAESFEVPP
jgi:hypothetical protein